jgi:hypothetical protein
MTLLHRFLTATTCLAALYVLPAAAADSNATLDGNAILARVAGSGSLQSYAVPVSFHVHMHKPISAGGDVGGIVYYRAPDQAALTITKAPPLIGNFFKGTYKIDLAPQVWAAKYDVSAVSDGRIDDTDAYLLQALPHPRGDVQSVTFAIAKTSFAPLRATWRYDDGSSVSISLAVSSAPFLPQTETVTVAKPQYTLDATCAFGTYATNAAIPNGIF